MRRQRRIYLYPRFRGFLPGGSARCEILPSPFPWISAGGVGAGTFAPGAAGPLPRPFCVPAVSVCVRQDGAVRRAYSSIRLRGLARARVTISSRRVGGFRFALPTQDERGAPSYIYKHSYMDIYSV